MYSGLARIAALAASLLVTGFALAEGSDVLYWMVDGSATINKWWSDEAGDAGIYNISQYFSSFYPEGSEFAARVRVTGDDITGDTFLQLYYSGGVIDDGEFGVDFENTVGGYWGAGVPTGNQSPSQDYSAGSPEYSFIVEIGNIVDDNWTTIATSKPAQYSELKNDYIHETFDMSPSALKIWTPASFTAVPEPSGGLLTALGLAMLALRRKRLDKGK